MISRAAVSAALRHILGLVYGLGNGFAHSDEQNDSVAGTRDFCDRECGTQTSAERLSDATANTTASTSPSARQWSRNLAAAQLASFTVQGQ